MISVMWAVLAGAMWAFVSAVFGLAFWTARKVGTRIPAVTYFACFGAFLLPICAAYVAYYFSRDALLPLTALFIGSLFGFQLGLYLKKRLTPN